MNKTFYSLEILITILSNITEKYSKYFVLCGFIIISLFISHPACSQVVIAGKVMSHETNQPIPFANIGILDSHVGTLSNTDGTFSIDIPEALLGDDLIFSALGFETKVITISQLHNAQRSHHFNKDSLAFANQLSDNFISVNRGEITKPKKGETISRYHNYFSSVEFHKWDDETEPIIRFSDDGSLAYTIVDKIVVLTYEDGDGQPVEDTTYFAWTAIYKKYGATWKIDCVTSTEVPGI